MALRILLVLLPLWNGTPSAAFHFQASQSLRRQTTSLNWSNGYDEDGKESKEIISPNAFESKEDHLRRMEMVRLIEKSFYGQSNSEGTDIGPTLRTTTTPNPDCNIILDNVPLMSARWSELPGYQSVLKAYDVPMYKTVMSGPKPWYFGHVFSRDENRLSQTGVLMQISDYVEREDGKLTLVVQALERFQIMEFQQQQPYTTARIKLSPDAELALHHYEAAQKMTQELSNDFLDDRDAWGAACAAALETGRQLQEYEFSPVEVSSPSMEEVSPLANYNMDIDVDAVFPSDYKLAQKCQKKVTKAMKKQLCSGHPVDVPEDIDELDDEEVIHMEHDVWLSVDRLVKLLHQLDPNPEGAKVAPVPMQMLGLLPRGSCHTGYIRWPNDFQLDMYANRLEDNARHSKSPFVRYDYAENALRTYPVLRRAQRLSFAVWAMIENLGLMDDDIDGLSCPPTKQEILEISSIAQRLEAAKDRIDEINALLSLIAAES